jgi:hypothetical protein
VRDKRRPRRERGGIQSRGKKLFPNQKTGEEIDTKEHPEGPGGRIEPSEVNRLNFGFFLTRANFVE